MHAYLLYIRINHIFPLGNFNQRPSYFNQGQNYNQGQSFNQGENFNRGPNFDQGPNFDRGPNFDQGQNFDRGPNFDQRPPHNQQYHGQKYDQGRYPTGGGGQDRRWDQNAGPGVRDVNQHYQNVPGGAPNYGGAPNHGRNQHYNDRPFVNDQPPGGGYGNMPPAAGRQPQDYPPRRVQDARPAPMEAWGPDQRQVHPQSKIKRFSDDIG